MQCRLNCFECPYPDCIANGNRVINRSRSDAMIERKKQKYAELVAKGICPYCGKAKATKGISCEPCYEYKRTKSNERRRKKRRFLSEGTCLKCGEERVEGSKYCLRHMLMQEKYKEYDRERKRRLRNEA